MKIHKKLGQKIFHYQPEYLDYFFEKKIKKCGVYSDYEGDALCAMAYFAPYPIIYKGKKCKGHFISGIATEPKYRHQKRMTVLLEQGIEVCHQEESPVVFLSPKIPRVFKSLGFTATYQRETTTINYKGSSWFTVVPYSDMPEEKKLEMSEFSEAMLAGEGFELYLIHSAKYYENIAKELSALGGGILVLYEGERVAAVVNYILSDGQYEVMELICQKNSGKKVLETICHYFEISFLTVYDSHFIMDAEGTGIEREKQEKPYIMYRVTSIGESPVLNCYINDLS